MSHSQRKLLFTLMSLTFLAGCTLFRGPAFKAPNGFATDKRAAGIANPQTRGDAYARLFPAPPKLQFKGELTASGHWWTGSQHFSTLYFAYRPWDGDEALRLSGFMPQAGISLFEIIVRDNMMTVVVPGEKAVYQGAIPPKGSPFRNRFGVEPWDLNGIFMVGQAVADGSYKTSGKGNTLVADAAASSSLPRTIELDSATGLPARATWKNGGSAYEVRYVAWDWFANSAKKPINAPEGPQLMPRRLIITRSSPRTRLDLELDHYQYGSQVPPRWSEIVSEVPLTPHPLAELDKALR